MTFNTFVSVISHAQGKAPFYNYNSDLHNLIWIKSVKQNGVLSRESL